MGKNPRVIALVHRDGEAYAAALRVRMRKAGLLGEEERDLTRLKPLHLTEAQQEQWVNYEPGRVIEFHQPVTGGFQSGQQWTVVAADASGVTVTRKGHEKVLSLDKVSGFSVYETETMPVSVADDSQLTKNDRKGRWRNGDVRRVQGSIGASSCWTTGVGSSWSKRNTFASGTPSAARSWPPARTCLSL